jgi:hypothetical protein
MSHPTALSFRAKTLGTDGNEALAASHDAQRAFAVLENCVRKAVL